MLHHVILLRALSLQIPPFKHPVEKSACLKLEKSLNASIEKEFKVTSKEERIVNDESRNARCNGIDPRIAYMRAQRSATNASWF